MDSKLIKHKAFPKPLLLKDYLREEMSSCSSNGFKSLPRRQCSSTTTIRFLMDMELNNLKRNQHKKSCFFFNRCPPPLLPAKSAASTAFRRITAAVKRLPFAAWGAPKTNGVKKTIFWRRKSSHKEIQRRKSFDQLLSDIPSRDDSAEANLNLSDGKRKDDEDKDEDDGKVRNGDVSGNSATGSAMESSREEKWSDVVISEERDQFSPGSVLDCPFDNDEEVSSPFQYMEESTKKVKLIAKIAEVEPLNISKRFPSAEEEHETDARDLLHRFMDTRPSSYDLKIYPHKLLLDFFKEKISMHCPSPRKWAGDDLIQEAECWINNIELCDDAWFLGWNRQPYEKEMGEWKSFDEEIGEIVLELEDVVLHEMFDGLLLDISSTHRL